LRVRSKSGAAPPLVQITRDLCRDVSKLSFGPPVAWVYNPLAYARAPHEQYLERYGASPKEVVLLGMNPGPFGMAQTGVPFGDVAMVRDWLGIQAPVSKPSPEHPKRPVAGFDCPRSEVSGTRIWGWARDRFGTPEAFFSRFFIANYCPLVFMEEGGRNVTPDKLRADERRALSKVCDRALVRTIEALAPKRVVGVGKFAETRAREALGSTGVRIGCILHPSPASPRANRGWAPVAEAQLQELGVRL
jgi:single-strand selective monofunctional uracil DNA glycosylase